MLAGVQERAALGVGLGVTQNVDRKRPGPLALAPHEEEDGERFHPLWRLGFIRDASVGKLWPKAGVLTPPRPAALRTGHRGCGAGAARGPVPAG